MPRPTPRDHPIRSTPTTVAHKNVAPSLSFHLLPSPSISFPPLFSPPPFPPFRLLLPIFHQPSVEERWAFVANEITGPLRSIAQDMVDRFRSKAKRENIKANIANSICQPLKAVDNVIQVGVDSPSQPHITHHDPPYRNPP